MSRYPGERQAPDGSLGEIPKFLMQFITVPGFSVSVENKETGRFYIIEAREVTEREFDAESSKADAIPDVARIVQNPEGN